MNDSKVDIVEVEFPEEIVVDLHFSTIHVDVMCQSEIDIDVNFDLTQKELSYMMELVGDKHEKRRYRIARYFFALKHTIKDIAEHVGISPTMVHKELTKYRQEVLKHVKKDLRANKKILGHMVELMFQTEHRINEAWIQYQNIDADSKVVGKAIRDTRERMNQDDKNPTKASLEALTEALNAVIRTHSMKQGYLAVLREETKTMLHIWKEFGLCGEDAMKIILSGGIDIDMKVKEVQTFLKKVIYIIKSEVKDESSASRVFTRMANEIRESNLYEKPDDGNAEDDGQ